MINDFEVGRICQMELQHIKNGNGKESDPTKASTDMLADTLPMHQLTLYLSIGKINQCVG